MDWSIRRLKSIQQIIGAKYYLEIGVQAGTTFCSLKMDHMDGVDPNFLFDIGEVASQRRHLHEMTSDQFFSKNLGADQYDLIFIDGLHTYDQTYRDFCNAALRLHTRSIIVIDDVLPCDRHSALRAQDDCIFSRRKDSSFDGENLRAWHGDVFRLLVFLNLFHTSLCYATVPGKEGVQTVVWSKALEIKAQECQSSPWTHPPFSTFDKPQLLLKKMWNLKSVDYQWMMNHKRLYNFCSESILLDYLNVLFQDASV